MTHAFFECPLCDNKQAENIASRAYPCKCGDELEVHEYACFDCGASFEVVDGEIVGEVINNIDEVFTTILPYNNESDIDEVVNFLSGLGVDPNTLTATDGTDNMSSFAHECLICKAPSFDNGAGIIACSKCNYEWEVIS